LRVSSPIVERESPQAVGMPIPRLQRSRLLEQFARLCDIPLSLGGGPGLRGFLRDDPRKVSREPWIRGVEVPSTARLGQPLVDLPLIVLDGAESPVRLRAVRVQEPRPVEASQGPREII